MEITERGSMNCHRCNGLMFPVDLRDWEGGLMNHQAAAWRCFACGDIVDQLIRMNRDRPQDDPEERRRRGARHRVGARGLLR
ncbi:MAG: hypothetical protein OJF52_002811 [Nitrospira sp.]|nr:MAG: hypothetical protein OJF52_002811 [Nitrospira sp.]